MSESESSQSQASESLRQPARVSGLFLAMATCVVAMSAAFVIATEIFLILFLGILFGVFLTKSSSYVSEKTPLAYGGSLAVVTTTLILGVLGCAVLFGMKIEGQVSEAAKHLDGSQQKFSEFLRDYPTAKSVLSSTPLVGDFISPPDDQNTAEGNDHSNGENGTPSEESTQNNRAEDGKTASQNSSEPPPVAKGTLSSAANKGIAALTGLFRTTLGLIVNSALIFFVGLFIAVAPTNYRDGIVTLMPKPRRERTREVLNEIGDSLWHWLIGRFGSMLITGIGAAVVLLIAGVPMAFLLGLTTGVLTFIPNIGSLIALTLSVLLAIPQGGTTVLVVIIGYMVLQLVESYVVTPLIQQKQVSLPPALLISFQAVMGVLFGFLGAAVASPLLAATKTGVEGVYIKDVLGDGDDTSS